MVEANDHPLDEGCEYQSLCRLCPLPKCPYDEVGGMRGYVWHTRLGFVTLLFSMGFQLPFICKVLRLTAKEKDKAEEELE